MSATFHFTFIPDWRYAPLAYWVHLPVAGEVGVFVQPAPQEIPHRGYRLLHVLFGAHELVFSSPEQLDHFIAVLATTPLPTSRQLSARRGAPIGPNSHWLSRLPASLKAPRLRARLVRALKSVRSQVGQPWAGC
jgi:hypothetical protein